MKKLLGGHSQVARWTKNVNIFALDKIFVPVHRRGVHWGLLVVSVADACITCYDSLGWSGEEPLQTLCAHMQAESLSKGLGGTRHCTCAFLNAVNVLLRPLSIYLATPPPSPCAFACSWTSPDKLPSLVDAANTRESQCKARQNEGCTGMDDSGDCGVFMIASAQAIADGVPHNYGQSDMPRMRRRLAATALGGTEGRQMEAASGSLRFSFR
jgi:hypothetical protein